MATPSTLYTVQNTTPLPFRASHPLAFNLYDQDGNYVLYIANDPAQAQLILELRNTATQPIELALVNSNQTASAQNYHIQLRFRAGVLAPVNLATYQKAPVLVDGWSVYAVLDSTSQQVTFYLLATQNTPFANGETRQIHLNLSAAASAGARGTQVEMLPNPAQVHYVSDKTEISGSQLTHLQIISHQGLRNLPLHVSFIGSNRVLNDGSLNATPLILEITNQLHKEDHGGGIIVLDPATTKLTLYFISSTDDWALTDPGSVASITLGLDANGATGNDNWAITGSAPSWTITPKKTQFALGESLKLYLKGIITTKSAGLSNLHLHYENIPGYWGGEFVSQIEKTPLLFLGSNVGIGTSAPEARLHIVGAAGVGQSIEIDDHEIKFRGDGAQHFSLFNNAISEYFTIANTGDDKKMGFSGTTLLAIHKSGNIGIGTSAPAAKLHIQNAGPQTSTQELTFLIGDNTKDTHLRLGYTKDFTFLQSSSPKGAEKLTLNPNGGNVGIGTTTINHQLTLGDSISYVGLAHQPKDESKQELGGDLLFYTGNTERMRIAKDGKVIIKSPLEVQKDQSVTINGPLTVAPGRVVKGIPIIDFKMVTVTAKLGDGWASQSFPHETVNFGKNIIDAQATLIGWDVVYDGDDGQYLNGIGLTLDITKMGQTVEIFIKQSRFNYEKGANYAYTWTCTVLVIAKLEASY